MNGTENSVNNATRVTAICGTERRGMAAPAAVPPGDYAAAASHARAAAAAAADADDASLTPSQPNTRHHFLTCSITSTITYTHQHPFHHEAA